MTLAEEFLLLALKDETGKPLIDGTRLRVALVGAALVELTLEGALRLTEDGDPDHRAGRLVPTGQAPTDPRLAELVAAVHDRKPKDALGKITSSSAWSNRAKSIQSDLLADLAKAGALTEEKQKILGLFSTTVWKAADPALEAEVMQRVRAAVVEGADPDDRTAALISIVHAVDLLPKLFPDADKRSAKSRGKEISDRDWGSQAIRKAVQEIEAVINAILISSVVATTAAS